MYENEIKQKILNLSKDDRYVLAQLIHDLDVRYTEDKDGYLYSKLAIKGPKRQKITRMVRAMIGLPVSVFEIKRVFKSIQ